MEAKKKRERFPLWKVAQAALRGGRGGSVPGRAPLLLLLFDYGKTQVGRGGHHYYYLENFFSAGGRGTIIIICLLEAGRVAWHSYYFLTTREPKGGGAGTSIII